MIKYLIKVIQSIKCKINCCFKSKCSMNDDSKAIEEVTVKYITSV